MSGQAKAIKGGRLIDGTGAEPVENATVIIEGTIIKAVGKDIEIPREARIIDATRKTVMPGLIDSHMHFRGFVTDAFHELEGIARPKELGLVKAVQDARDYLAAGFTTARDCYGANGVFLKAAVAEGILSGMPRIIAAGYPLGQTGGHCDTDYLPPKCADVRTSRHGTLARSQGLVCDGPSECAKAARYTLRQGADFVKVFATGGPYPYYEEFNEDELAAIVRAAAQQGKFVTAHCENSRGAKNCIVAGVRSLEHCYEMSDEVIALAKERGTIFVSTLTSGWEPRKEREFRRTPQGFGYIPTLERMKANRYGPVEERAALAGESYKRILKAGLILAAGSDRNGAPGNEHGNGKNAISLEILVNLAGFTPMEAIVAATKNGAIVCSMADKTGTIEPGKFADIIIVDGDPLANVSVLRDLGKIKMVMLEGKVEVNRGL